MSFKTPQNSDFSYVHQGVRNVYFWKIWRALFSCDTRFEIRFFPLLLPKSKGDTFP